MTAGLFRAELVTTEGIFELDGGRWEVTNNIWIVGDDTEVIVIDAAHDHRPVVDAVGGRRLVAVLLTHGHNDHINAAAALREASSGPVYLHPADRMLWDAVYPADAPDGELEDGQQFHIAGCRLSVLHTPGHSPGSCCFFMNEGTNGRAVLFSGDTLFNGGPGATSRSYSDKPTILASIRDKLLRLPAATLVHTGHGEDTSVGAEAANLLRLPEGLGPR